MLTTYSGQHERALWNLEVGNESDARKLDNIGCNERPTAERESMPTLSSRNTSFMRKTDSEVSCKKGALIYYLTFCATRVDFKSSPNDDKL